MSVLLMILVVIAGCGLFYFFFRRLRLRRQSLHWTELVNGVTLVTFLDRKILDLNTIQELGDKLIAMVEQERRTALVLDFRIVEFLSTAMIGNLVILDKKVKEKSGRLVLCNLTPVIKEVLAVTRLNQVFEIEDSLDEALAMFQD
jgi:anti-sigma B factor antagonist